MTEHTSSVPATAEDGADLLNAVEAHHSRFTVLPSEAAYVAVVLWAAHTHLLDSFETTPRLALLSQKPGSGKTRTLAVIGDLVPRPMDATGVSPSVLARTIHDKKTRPTVLLDESDTVFGPKAVGSEDLRGLINAGHRRGGHVLRCVGGGTTQTVQAFPTHFALAAAGLGDLPDTVMSRSVVIRMRRRTCDERIEPYRERIHQAQGHALRERLATWADTVRGDVSRAVPDLPNGIFDRAADVWEPLLAVADAAGGHWPERARTACTRLAKANDS
ncbi:DUF3631 domain-containing protein [Kitasatospora sp. NPDC093550]|uniref:DUF3631 domain-containing protein n=1 Tax=Kitasatospora sp. NPDC093550 TaxID=3364089 RepID=UPI0037F10C85